MLRIYVHHHSLHPLSTDADEIIHFNGSSRLSLSMLWARNCIHTSCNWYYQAIIFFSKFILLVVPRSSMTCANTLLRIHLRSFLFQVTLKTNEKILGILNEDIPNILSYLLVVPGKFFLLDLMFQGCYILKMGLQIFICCNIF